MYTPVIVLVVLYGCETWCFTLSEEHMLMMSENRMLRGISGLKRAEVTRGWWKSHNEKLSFFF
jgi:hypothetical protein